MEFNGIPDAQAVTTYGIYATKYITLQNVPVALASAMSAATIPAISSSWARRNRQETVEQIRSSINVTMLILIPACVGMAVLSYPIIGLLFPQEETMKIASSLLTYGSPAIVFYGLSTLTNGILQALGEVNAPLRNATKALICNIILVFLLLFLTPLGLYSLIVANCFYPLQVSYLNQKALRKKLKFKQEIRKTYILPLIASIIMGIFVTASYYGLFTLTHKVLIPLVISIILGVIIYFSIILYFYADHPEELEAIPYMNKIIAKLKRT